MLGAGACVCDTYARVRLTKAPECVCAPVSHSKWKRLKQHPFLRPSAQRQTNESALADFGAIEGATETGGSRAARSRYRLEAPAQLIFSCHRVCTRSLDDEIRMPMNPGRCNNDMYKTTSHSGVAVGRDRRGSHPIPIHLPSYRYRYDRKSVVVVVGSRFGRSTPIKGDLTGLPGFPEPLTGNPWALQSPFFVVALSLDGSVDDGALVCGNGKLLYSQALLSNQSKRLGSKRR